MLTALLILSSMTNAQAADLSTTLVDCLVTDATEPNVRNFEERHSVKLDLAVGSRVQIRTLDGNPAGREAVIGSAVFRSTEGYSITGEKVGADMVAYRVGPFANRELRFVVQDGGDTDVKLKDGLFQGQLGGRGPRRPTMVWMDCK